MITKLKSGFFTSLILAMIVLFSCSNAVNKSEPARSASMDAVTASPQVAGSTPVERKIIKTGSISFVSRDVAESMNRVRELTSKSKGLILSENSFDRDGEKGFDVSVKVPAASFEAFTESVVNAADVRKIVNVSKEASDVTEEFVDVEARMKVKKESEARLMELLKSAKNLSEVLEIEQKLTDIRAEIESIEGRLKYLSSQTEMSTVNISFYEKDPYSGHFFADFWDGIKGGWQVFLLVLARLAYLWVLIAAGVLAWWLIRKYRRSKKNRNQPPKL